jgi:predicted nucleic acid-binding protein
MKTVLKPRHLSGAFFAGFPAFTRQGPLVRSQYRRSYGAWVREPTTSATVIRAINIAEMAQLTFWDALIMASAEEMHATHIYSEDLNAGQTIAGVKVVNPLAVG